MTETKYNYMNDLAIDPHDLPEEWLRQPALYMQYSELAAQAGKERDQAKENLDVVKAEVDAHVRTYPDLYGIAKITETQVSNAVIVSDKYREAQQLLTDANLNYSLMQAAVRAFEQRKAALENSVRMMLGGIFSVPNEGQQIAAGKRIMESAVAAASQDQRDGLRVARGKAALVGGEEGAAPVVATDESAPTPRRRRAPK